MELSAQELEQFKKFLGIQDYNQVKENAKWIDSIKIKLLISSAIFISASLAIRRWGVFLD